MLLDQCFKRMRKLSIRLDGSLTRGERSALRGALVKAQPRDSMHILFLTVISPPQGVDAENSNEKV